MDLKKARQLLALDIEVSRREIREAYHRAARRWHPDSASPDKAAECHRRMLEINEAYQVILNFIDKYRYRLEDALEVKEDYEAWWDTHFGPSMGWPNQPRRGRPKKS